MAHRAAAGFNFLWATAAKKSSHLLRNRRIYFNKLFQAYIVLMHIDNLKGKQQGTHSEFFMQIW